MTNLINSHTVSSINVQEIFKGGDDQGARIMLGN
jgi:hypothetical protein